MSSPEQNYLSLFAMRYPVDSLVVAKSSNLELCQKIPQEEILQEIPQEIPQKDLSIDL